MKSIVLSFLMMASMVLTSAQTKSFYDFNVPDINGENFDFASLKGKKVMVVNVASKCGLTGQYEGLQSLYEKYGGDDFVIIGFPANNFMKQEPGSEEEIKTFCTSNYGVTFPMMSKVSVKGDDQHPLYQWLTQKELNGYGDSKVGWNFQKYLINSDGTISDVISPRTKPDDMEILNWIVN